MWCTVLIIFLVNYADDKIKKNKIKLTLSKQSRVSSYSYLHWRLWITENHPLAVTELGVHYGDVPQGDVLIDEVLVHGALHIVRQLGPADAAGVGGAEEGRVRLLGRADPDRELLRGLHPDVLIQNVGDSSPNRLIAASKLHIDSLRVTHVTSIGGFG